MEVWTPYTPPLINEDAHGWWITLHQSWTTRTLYDTLISLVTHHVYACKVFHHYTDACFFFFFVIVDENHANARTCTLHWPSIAMIFQCRNRTNNGTDINLYIIILYTLYKKNSRPLAYALFNATCIFWNPIRYGGDVLQLLLLSRGRHE